MKKFRLWNKLDSCFVDPVLITAFPRLLGEILLGISDDCIADQWLGIKDYNGVEIYENDIVHIAGTPNGVASINSFLGVVYTDRNNEFACHHDAMAENDRPTVIGNIHQNKDLLK